jgi:hypothetical protein|tara:strand:- start:60 stop:326 length:267 start_codon:yes stop_codon:yes gene_type:complete
MDTKATPEDITPTRVVLRYFYPDEDQPETTTRQAHDAICSLVGDNLEAMLTSTIEQTREKQNWRILSLTALYDSEKDDPRVLALYEGT